MDFGGAVKDIFSYHNTFATSLADIFALSKDALSESGPGVVQKRQMVNEIKINIIYAITVARNKEENKEDYKKLKDGKFFSEIKDIENIENLFRIMVEKQDLAGLTANHEYDHIPHGALASVEAARADLG